jgi:16S rRNA (cytosine967-C5)-methyltransferase
VTSTPGRRPLASSGCKPDSSTDIHGTGAEVSAGTPAGFDARILALDATEAVLLRRRPLDHAFETHPLVPALAGRDRAFAFNLVSTVLRRLGQIDALIDGCLARPLPARMTSVRGLLRVGVAQLVFLRTPAHAAVHTTVELARRRRAGTHASLINAVLRRLAGEGARRAEAQDAARLNTPDWLWHSWTAAYGEPVTRSIAEIHLTEPPLDLTVRPEADLQRLTDALGARRLPTGTLRLWHAGPVTELPGYDEGAWWVQDAAAALPAKLLGDVRGRRVLDLCAAPGGKTAQLAAAGADVVAVDRSPERVRRVENNLRRLGLRAETTVADVANWRPPAPADRVLLDVPCSATGTIRRHPDILRLKTSAEIPAMTKLQARLLAAAAEMLAPDGILVYCVCSLQPEEGERLVNSSIAEGLPLRRAPLGESEAHGFEQFLTSVGDLRTLPSQAADCGGLDGFYAARLRRSADARDL